MTPNMVAALQYLATIDKPETSMNRLGWALDIRYRKGNAKGQRKTFGIGSAANQVCKGLERLGFAEKALTDDHIGDGLTFGWQITEAGRAHLRTLS
jgi:hypothetical protein